MLTKSTQQTLARTKNKKTRNKLIWPLYHASKPEPRAAQQGRATDYNRNTKKWKRQKRKCITRSKKSSKLWKEKRKFGHFK